MSDIPENQIGDWLKKLERESWQLELLVSAFTIFLLIQAIISFDALITLIENQYNFQSSQYSMLYLFLGLLHKSLEALAVCLITHLMLRGFWIGTIGLRSVQSNIDFRGLNYNEFFTDMLKKKVISLDQLVIRLDEICSVIFAFAFLVISILLSFGLYLIFLGSIALSLNAAAEVSPQWFDPVIVNGASLLFLVLLLSGIIYMLDYFTLGFFKKIKWFAKIYYPFYRLYNYITLAVLSRSIYYYMISKFSKRKIRMVYAVVGFLLFFTILFDFDQHIYFPSKSNEHLTEANCYDNLRPSEEYIEKASIASDYLDRPYFKVFIRYDAKDNAQVQAQCKNYTPIKNDGFNWRLKTTIKKGNVHISNQKYDEDDFDQMLACLSSIYQLAVNDSVYTNLKYRFYRHPSKDQRGLLTTIPTDQFLPGENLLSIKKIVLDSAQIPQSEDFVTIPFWYHKAE